VFPGTLPGVWSLVTISSGRQRHAILTVDAGARSRTVVRLGDEFHALYAFPKFRGRSPIAEYGMDHVRDVDPSENSEDLLNTSAILSIRNGAEMFMLPAETMGPEAPIAALFRY